MTKLFLFDVDGTLAESTMTINSDIVKVLEKMRKEDYILGIVGGGNYKKILSQITDDHLHLFKYIFSENGLVSFEDGKCIHNNNLKNIYSEKEINDIVNIVLKYEIDLDLPYKRGSFMIMRNGMWYYTPIGSDCSYEERLNFIEYNKTNNILRNVVKELKPLLEPFNLDVLLGGSIGVGIHPKGWDKSYTLQFLDFDKYDEVYFFGDRCTPDGNDYPLYSCDKIKGYSVDNPKDTYDYLIKILNY